MKTYIPSSADEAEYLRRYDPDKYKKPSVSVDTVVFAKSDGGLFVLLIRRGGYPYKSRIAVPGGFLNMSEDLSSAAKRELFEETGLDADICQCYTLGTPGRDPRDRVITVLFASIIDLTRATAGDDAAEAVWARVSRYGAFREAGGTRHTFEVDYDGETFTVSGVVADSFAPAHQSEMVMDDCPSLSFDHAEELLRALLFTGCERYIQG